MTQTATVYAQALYQLAAEEHLSKEILQQLQTLKACFDAEPEYLQLLSNPALSKQERCGLLDDSFRPLLQPYLLNFLKILTEKGLLRHFSDCCTVYQNQYYQDNNILPVTAVTAVSLNDNQTQQLTQKLSSITGKSILLSKQVDASLLGGVRLDYDGTQVDDTLSHRLERIRSLLKNTML